VWMLQDVLPAHLPAAGLLPLGVGIGSGLVLLAGFALPPVLRLKRVPPLRVLRRELAPVPAGGWLVYGTALAVTALLMWGYTGSAALTATVFGGAAVGGALLALLALGLLAAGRRLPAGGAWRYGVSALWRRPTVSVGQLLAFALTLAAMALVALVRTDLMDTWRAQLAPDTPNHFAINIQPQEREQFRTGLKSLGVAATPFYPVVRGRLVGINGEPLEAALSSAARDDGAINRELNLTWSTELPPENRLTDGRWWPQAKGSHPAVSVEVELAARLGVGMGDRLTFSIGGQPFTAEVRSLREVQWDTFRPNFFMIFPPGALEGFPATWLTSFHLPPPARGALPGLIREFPAVTVIDVEMILSQVRAILAQVTLAVESMLLFLLAAGLAVLFAALAASQQERLHEGALLRALGAGRRQVRGAHLAEFTLLGLFAGLLGALLAELIAWLVYTRALALPYRPQWWLWLLMPPAGILLIGGAGLWGTRWVLRESPLAVLRRL